jgi:hypothetical protein
MPAEKSSRIEVFGPHLVKAIGIFSLWLTAPYDFSMHADLPALALALMV